MFLECGHVAVKMLQGRCERSRVVNSPLIVCATVRECKIGSWTSGMLNPEIALAGALFEIKLKLKWNISQTFLRSLRCSVRTEPE